MYLEELPAIIHMFYYEILFFQIKVVFFLNFKDCFNFKDFNVFVDIHLNWAN